MKLDFDPAPIVAFGIAQGWVTPATVPIVALKRPEAGKYQKKLRAKRVAAGQTAAGKPRQRARYPELRGLARTEYLRRVQQIRRAKLQRAAQALN